MKLSRSSVVPAAILLLSLRELHAADLVGRVIEDCTQIDRIKCKGLRGALVVLTRKGASRSHAACAAAKPDLIAKTASGPDGTFKLSIAKQAPGLMEICLLSYNPLPRYVYEVTSPVVVALTPAITNATEAGARADVILARANSRAEGEHRPVDKAVDAEWRDLDQWKYSPESKVLLARAVLSRAPAAKEVAAIVEYADSNEPMIAEARTYVKRMYEGNKMALGPLKASVPKGVLNDVVRDELKYAEPWRECAVSRALDVEGNCFSGADVGSDRGMSAAKSRPEGKAAAATAAKAAAKEKPNREGSDHKYKK